MPSNPNSYDTVGDITVGLNAVVAAMQHDSKFLAMLSENYTPAQLSEIFFEALTAVTRLYAGSTGQSIPDAVAGVRTILLQNDN